MVSKIKPVRRMKDVLVPSVQEVHSGFSWVKKLFAQEV
jgi:hypothetical protein